MLGAAQVEGLACKGVGLVQIYTEFLSAGGSRSPKELVGMFGFDIEEAAFWQIGINEVRKLVEEFCLEA